MRGLNELWCCPQRSGARCEALPSPPVSQCGVTRQLRGCRYGSLLLPSPHNDTTPEILQSSPAQHMTNNNIATTLTCQSGFDIAP